MAANRAINRIDLLSDWCRRWVMPEAGCKQGQAHDANVDSHCGSEWVSEGVQSCQGTHAPALGILRMTSHTVNNSNPKVGLKAARRACL